ncbi:MAG: efflux RND transporter periplasmic adaptor subunit [Rhodovulum sp.]|nr:efflux RND transporter periplasmic adaptor subunit [Rhodovulum sp.]
MGKSVVRGLVIATLLAGAASLSVPFVVNRLLPAQAETHAGAHDRGARTQPILYWRDPSGRPSWSASPTEDASGRPYLPVYDADEPPLAGVPKPAAADASRKILYYRNPMGLPDVSPTPKKDPMGMDYVPVYDGEEPTGGAIKVSLAKIQRSGVRTEPASTRVLIRPVRGVGTVKYDESRLTAVTVRSESYVEDLFVNTTGARVRAGQPLFRIYSRDIQLAQVDLNVAISAQSRGVGGLGPQPVDGAMQKLRNLGVPERHIEEVRTKGINPRTVNWVSAGDGVVIEKKIVNGQRLMPGDELYRIADLSRMWVIAEVSELDLPSIAEGMHASVTLRAYPTEPREGTVTFIYPDLRPETRTARVRIELDNPDGRLRNDMYADVVFHAGADAEPAVTVPESAVMDSGSRKVVFVSKEDGRFEPRDVRLGRQGQGYVEIRDGVAEGEAVVTTATFLIDSESNLNAALKSFVVPEQTP